MSGGDRRDFPFREEAQQVLPRSRSSLPESFVPISSSQAVHKILRSSSRLNSPSVNPTETGWLKAVRARVNIIPFKQRLVSRLELASLSRADLFQVLRISSFRRHDHMCSFLKVYLSQTHPATLPRFQR